VIIVVVVIVAILAAIATSFYEHAIENVRRADVLSLMGTVISSQDRYRVMKHRYTKLWHYLDVAPVPLRHPMADNPYANGIDNTIYFTRGKNDDGTPRSGFQVYFEEINGQWFMTADRVGNEKYSYTIVRPFNSLQAFCVPTGNHEKSKTLCMDMMGVDDLSMLPPDPRIEARMSAENGD
jgi:type II secretory pathway pseudopilin PulG